MKHPIRRTRKREAELLYDHLPEQKQESVESMRTIIDFMLSLPENREKETVSVGLIGESTDHEVLFKVCQHYRKEFGEILFEPIDSAIPFYVLSFKRRAGYLTDSQRKHMN